MTGIGTLWRTVRHLKREQVVGRLRMRLRPGRVDLRGAPLRRKQTAGWVGPARRRPSLSGTGQLRVLNVDYDLDARGWEDPTLDRLRRYNLHYFDDLNAASADTRVQAQRALVTRWITDNAPGRGTGWEPYPVSLRIVNWIKWFMSGAAPEPAWLASLAVQARWLRSRVEWHLLGNHLFTNAKALSFAGLFFEGEEADEWFDCGSRIIERELREQMLPDGGHFERSPMYHALALEDVLDLLNLAIAFGVSPFERSLREPAPSMLFYLRCLSHPDASLASFNDTAQNVAPPAAELERYAAELHVTGVSPPLNAVTHLPQSGYVRASQGRALLLADVAAVGPDYLPGHAHADTLSFELSLGTRRVIVNGGTSCYGVCPRRAYERSTAAHSTVEVAEANSSEVWSSFRVGRRARPFDLTLSDFTIACSHDGYRFLPGRPVHRRSWRLESGALTVEDKVMPGRSPAIARYILAPGLQLRESAPARWQIFEGEVVIAVAEVELGRGTPAAFSYAPEFGLVLPVEGLAVSLIDGQARVKLTWTGDAHPVSH
jgi:hypothetical protein